MKTSFANHIRNLFLRAAVPVALAAAVSACSDYIEAPGPDFTVSDEPTNVTVSLSIPSMTPVSRADLSNAQLKQVNSVWVRTYSSITGEATCDWVKVQTGHSDEHISHTADLKTKSGYNFIVAVANVENPGVTVDENGNISEEKPLSTLLEAADTWQKFLAISACTPNTTEQLFNGISQQYPTIPMSGIYTSASDMNHPDGGWESACYTPIFIPVDKGNPYKLPGMIHLRRLISQINFNIMPGDDVTISPQSFTVVNAPDYSWLYERQSGVEGVNPNPGDACTEDTKDNFYTTSEQFASNYIYPLTGNNVPEGSYTFNYWQGENKHMALPAANCDTYNKRELENKRTAEGAVPGTSSSLQNTGVYVSLSGYTWTPNNMASYVILRCDVTLKNPVSVDGRDYTREGNGIYVIHLGYCEGDNAAEKSADFNCRRNINYTYNITVKDINNIYVEAVADTETQPGAEGLVSDVENKTIMLDCHYGSFNVYLTDEELGFTHDTDYTFGYIVQAFFGGTEYTFDENNPPANDNERALVRWIELRPTTGENVLADYKPLAPKTGSDGSTFTLDMVQNGLSDDCRSASGWYTVFVNEYVYEADADESTGADNWTKYVNQNNRRAYIRVRHGLSADGESAYAQSKYGVSQHSIQTYYSLDNYTPAEGAIPAKTAIGVEHINELRGLNMRRSYSPTGVLDANNGRYNVWAWLNGTNSGTAPQSGSASKSWSTVVQTNTLQSIPAMTNTNQYYTQAASVQNMPALAQFGGTLNPSPQDPVASSNTRSDYIEAINACMSRNRDLNGNGTIEPEELRWYVPALGKYLRMILGRNSLQTPLMDYANTPRIYVGTGSGDNGYATRLIVYASNNYALWAMEGLSSSAWTGNFPLYTQGGPWEVRCIRNLGSNLSTVTPGEKVSAAYSHDAAKRVVTMSYYDLNSIRTEKFSQTGTPMVLHNLANQEYNRCYYAFQYAESNSTQTNGTNMNTTTGIYNPCSSLNDSDPEKRWRVPNQKELTIMQNLGVLSNISNVEYYISCTVSYYTTTGQGMTLNSNLTNRKVMAAVHNTSASNATQIPFTQSGYVRCVRDVDPDEL